MHPVEQYVKETFNDETTIRPWQKQNSVPVYVRSLYAFYEMTVLNEPCVLLEVIAEVPGIEALVKHSRQIEALTDWHVVFLFKEVSRYRRRNLLHYRIPFITTEGQIFLPFLGAVLKPAPSSVGFKAVDVFSPSTQVTFLYFLYHKDAVVHITMLADILGFTPMTASRALQALYSARLLTCTIGGKTGRMKEYQRIQDPDYFQKGAAYLASPVKRIVSVKKEPKVSAVAGLDALSRLSMISPPERPVRAVGRDQLRKEEVCIIEDPDIAWEENAVELEIWSYDPLLFAKDGHVDVLSLYASLRDVTDERVEQAIEEVMKGYVWYMG